MSKFQRKPLYNDRGLQTQWINLIFQSHDLICGCNDPTGHFNDLINQQKCLPSKDAATTETGGTTEDPEPTIDEGDLEKLFSEENDVDEG